MTETKNTLALANVKKDLMNTKILKNFTYKNNKNILKIKIII